MAAHRPLLHWLLLFALVAMWGSSFLFTKIAVAAIAPTDLVAGRFLLATATLAAVLAATRRRLPGSPRLWLFFLAMALMGNCIPFWLITWGQQRIDSGLAGILMAIMPLTTVMLAHFLVAGERLNRFKAAGFLLGFLGIVVLMAQRSCSSSAAAARSCCRSLPSWGAPSAMRSTPSSPAIGPRATRWWPPPGSPWWPA